MSGASFWAKGSQNVKTATVSRPVMAETPPKVTEAATEPKKGVLLKRKYISNSIGASANIAGTANGIGKITEPIYQAKRTNWADSDEDDDAEFLASFTSSATEPRVQELEHVVTTKNSRIGELISTLAARDGRISDLEGLLKEKNDHIADLETNVEVKVARIRELQVENQNQYLQLQEFVAEIDEKDRCISKLEHQLEEKTAAIRELEMDSGSQTQASTDDIDTTDEKLVKDPASTTAEPTDILSTDGLENKPAKHVSEDPQVIELPKVKLTPASATVEVNTNSETSTKEMPGPSPNLAEFPHYVLPKTVKTLPPPPPAPKLKLGIDLSKFGKKPAAKPLEPKKTNDLAAPVSSYGYSSKQHTKTDVIPKINPSRDVRTMKHIERALFANGPEVIVMMNDKQLATLPKYIFMQCSTKANKHFTENPSATTMAFEANSMEEEAAKAHLRWMDEMTFQGRVYSLTLSSNEQNDVKNLNICRAARVLGINNIYVGHFTRVFCDRLRSQQASMSFMSLVAELAYPDNDPIFDCMAHNLASMRVRGTMSKELDATLLGKYANLKDKIEKIEKRMIDKRKSDAKKAAGTKKSSLPK